MGFEANRRVETSVRTFELIEHLSQTEGKGISALSERLDISKGIVHNHLSTLRELGYVTKNGNKYQLSSKFFSLGLQVRNQSPVYRYGKMEIDRLADQFETPIVLIQRCGDLGVVIYSNGSSDMVETDLQLGTATHLCQTLPGAAILVTISEEKRNQIIDSYTNDSIYDYGQIFDFYATNNHVVGSMTVSGSSRGIAAPLLSTENFAQTAIGVLIPQDEDHLEEHINSELDKLEEKIMTQMNYDWESNRSFATIKHGWFNE